ncbi:hypothetical protein IIV22A_061L [Invertebrate iridescent virus 22]|uniref:Uncharacterized protein n=1 Tax=Invertebrate iridescent virus 22 TaxID=345198 RepID=W8W2B3_9VIRU|nr:hypothetical protein IIV22A_061L [Invertebrate iridescent virus 22]CCV01905.1 hypothetical protein IIV22A_061L [Invertebrate iridescent virus 22]
MLVEHDNGLSDLKNKFNQLEEIVKHLGENDAERIKDTKTWVPQLVSNTQDISDLKIKFNNFIAPSPLIKETKFSLNSKGNFHHEIKKTFFFEPGLFLPDKIFISSLYLTVNIKNQAKHPRKFELIIIPDGTPTPIHQFEKDALEEFIMEEFNPPLEIPAKTKIMLTCDKKVEGMAVFTLKY